MRLTVCLEGNAEGRVLASVDMEEIVKMTITDDIEKSNFNPQMFKSCTDSSYQCGYQQGKSDERRKVLAPYDVESIEELVKNVRAKTIDKCINAIDTEYYDCGYGDYHEVEMVVRLLKQMKGDKE